MAKEFKYNIFELIDSIRNRPCIWDKTLESHKDRVERRVAWEEVFCILDERYDDMTPAEQKITGDRIMNKWTNIRDTFMKSLKKRIGKPKRRYMLYNQLTFLLKCVPKQEYDEEEGDEDVDYNSTDYHDESFNVCKSENEDYEDEEETIDKISHMSSNVASRKRESDVDHEVDMIGENPKRFKDYDNLDALEFVEPVEEGNDPRILNEDEAFFASLLPSVVKYSEDERLEFRIGILALMRKIKENRDWDS